MTRDLAVGVSAAGLVSLDDPAAEASARTGNKAATLAMLRRAGFRVPPGVVVTADAALDTLAKVPDLLGAGPWAVRSSSSVEDGQERSFAGQFETILNVDSGGLSAAVIRCRRSGLADRVKAYAGERGPGSIAVLIQRMVPAAAAGVAFSIDPVTGRGCSVIEAVAGLGERLVSGAATPERWTVDPDGTIEAPSPATVLETEQARAIADLARKVEAHFGRPQDIEWAIAGGELWLLQTRPVTTLPSAGIELIPIPTEAPPPGFWQRDTFHWPLPQSPFGRVLMFDQLVNVFPRVFAELGMLMDRVELRFIGGWAYSQVIPVGAPPSALSGGFGVLSGGRNQPPRWLLALLMRLHPAIRRRAAAAERAIATDLPFTIIRRWFDEWRPEFQADARRALALDLGSLSDQELAGQLAHRIEMLGRPEHSIVGLAYFVVLFELAAACRELLGWDTVKMLTLLEGLSTASSEPARQLASIAELARAKPAIRDLLQQIDETTPERLAGVDAEFAQAFTRYVDATGHRSVRWDVIDPNLAEMPHLLLRLVADQLEVGFSPDAVAQEAMRRRNQAADDARSLLASRPAADRERFERALARARETYPAFEDRVWHTTSVQLGLLRYLALEIGRRLADRGQLAAVEDVFFLETQEARSALLDGGDRRDTARIRKGQRAWAIANPGPLTFGVLPSGEPPFDLLPPAARHVNESLVWGLTLFLGGERPSEKGPNLVAGAPASRGRYTGTVRVVMGEHEFGKIRKGDVVVCPVTSPAWSFVFPIVGALVTNEGGILSHPAIIAREHGIPAVVGTGNATSLLKDGQRVTVDGNQGVVELLDA